MSIGNSTHVSTLMSIPPRPSPSRFPARGIRVALWVWLALAVSVAAAAQLRTSITPTGRQGLVLAGRFVGFALSAEGGHTQGVVTQIAGPQGGANKTLSGLEHTPLVVRMGVPVDPALLTWISNALAGNTTPQTLQLVSYDATNKPIATRELQNALLTAVTLPALDAASKQAVSLELEITPASIAYSQGGDAPTASLSPKTKAATAMAYRVTVGDLPTQRVTKVAALRWSRAVEDDHVGMRRMAEMTAASPTIGDLELHVSQVDAPAWEKWFHDFVIQGNAGSDQELDGAIELLAADLATTILTVKLSHAGVFALERGTGSDFVARLYVEAISLEPGAK